MADPEGIRKLEAILAADVAGYSRLMQDDDAATVATLDRLSGGRVLLGLGTSGPQVAEGWHGQAWGKPLTRTREYVSIVRTILRREVPLEHHGDHYDVPYTGGDATGLGKPLKIIVHPPRSDVPIYLAAIGPKNVALAAEIADGWLPIFFSPERFAETHRPMLDEGFARRGGRPDGWDLAAHVPVVVADDVQAARPPQTKDSEEVDTRVARAEPGAA